MLQHEIVYCYCFNPLCVSSIFCSQTFSGIPISINKALSEISHCASCNSELVTKANLEIKSEIKISLSEQKPLQAIVIDDDAFFHIVIENVLKQELSITNTKCHYNGADAIDYLKAHRHHTDYLPDVIFVDIRMPVMDGWGFLEAYEKLFAELDKKSQVYITSGFIEPGYSTRTKKYRFVKGLIAKPFSLEALTNLSADLIPVF